VRRWVGLGIEKLGGRAGLKWALGEEEVGERNGQQEIYLNKQD